MFGGKVQYSGIKGANVILRNTILEKIIKTPSMGDKLSIVHANVHCPCLP